MKKFILVVTFFASIAAKADPTIFDSRDVPGPARGTVMCSGKQLSHTGIQVMSAAVDALFIEVSNRGYLQPNPSDANRWLAFTNLVGEGLDGAFLKRHVYPRAKQVLGEAYFAQHGFYPVRIYNIARASNGYANFKYLMLANFGQINCDSLHYRGLGEALYDQFGR